MNDLISKEKLRHDIAMLIMNNNSLIDTWLANCIDDIIDEQPTIEAEPVKHGRWIIDEYGIRHCPFCKAINNTVYTNYCPNCGARMDGEEE